MITPKHLIPFLKQSSRETSVTTLAVFLYIGFNTEDNNHHVLQHEMTEYLGLHKSASVRATKQLVDKELIIKKEGNINRVHRILSLTDEGRELFNSMSNQ